jgi:hypothetical protein
MVWLQDVIKSKWKMKMKYLWKPVFSDSQEWIKWDSDRWSKENLDPVGLYFPHSCLTSFAKSLIMPIIMAMKNYRRAKYIWQGKQSSPPYSQNYQSRLVNSKRDYAWHVEEFTA